jgi:5-methylcytosine-specific restriction endonuclease McrA
MNYKICTYCNESKPILKFSLKNKKYKTIGRKYSSRCKKCEAILRYMDRYKISFVEALLQYKENLKKFEKTKFICKQCEAEFWLPRYRVLAGRGSFCSPLCVQIYAKKSYGKPVKRMCLTCNFIFIVPPSSTQKFCSRSCVRRPDIYVNNDIRKCPTCCKVFEVIPSNPKIFCSRRCFSKSRIKPPSLESKIKNKLKAQKKFLFLLKLKRCGECKKIKDLNFFPPLKQTFDGKAIYCYTCQRDKSKSWRKNNPDKVRELKRRREIKKRGAKGFFSEKEFKRMYKEYGSICLCRHSSIPFAEITRDHIKSLSCGGNNYISNIQPLCHLCNSKKGIQEIDYRPFPFPS